jgi:8-oxo-dGTP diphosphatase
MDQKIISGVVIENEGKILLVQERKPHVRGLWNLPAGHVKDGETPEQTAIREAKEETGLDVELIVKLGVYSDETDPKPKHAFHAKIIGGELRFPPDELLDARWFSDDEIAEIGSQIRNIWVAEAIAELHRRKIVDTKSELGKNERNVC